MRFQVFQLKFCPVTKENKWYGVLTNSLRGLWFLLTSIDYLLSLNQCLTKCDSWSHGTHQYGSIPSRLSVWVPWHKSLGQANSYSWMDCLEEPCLIHFWFWFHSLVHGTKDNVEWMSLWGTTERKANHFSVLISSKTHKLESHLLASPYPGTETYCLSIPN